MKMRVEKTNGMIYVWLNHEERKACPNVSDLYAHVMDLIKADAHCLVEYTKVERMFNDIGEGQVWIINI